MISFFVLLAFVTLELRVRDGSVRILIVRLISYVFPFVVYIDYYD